MDVGELRLRHDPRRHRLLVLGERLGIVDLDQHRSGGDVLTALDGDFCNAPVDAGCNVEPGRVDLALHQQRRGRTRYQIDSAATAAAAQDAYGGITGPNYPNPYPQPGAYFLEDRPSLTSRGRGRKSEAGRRATAH
jgi:hypothetical protein